MKMLHVIALAVAGLCGCEEKRGAKIDPKDVARDVDTFTARYAGEWRGRSEKSNWQTGFDWTFALSNNGDFSLRVYQIESDFSESFAGEWRAYDGLIVLFPAAPGSHFFPIVDQELANEGIGYPVFVKNGDGVHEFMFGCCDNGGRDYHVAANRVEQDAAMKRKGE